MGSEHSLNKPYLTDIYLTDSTRAFISGISLYPTFKPFEIVWNQVPYFGCSYI